MSKPMNRKQAMAEARRRAEETDEWQIIHVSHPSKRYKKFGVLSQAEFDAGGVVAVAVECVRPMAWGG